MAIAYPNEDPERPFTPEERAACRRESWRLNVFLGALFAVTTVLFASCPVVVWMAFFLIVACNFIGLRDIEAARRRTIRKEAERVRDERIVRQQRFRLLAEVTYAKDRLEAAWASFDEDRGIHSSEKIDDVVDGLDILASRLDRIRRYAREKAVDQAIKEAERAWDRVAALFEASTGIKVRDRRAA